MDGTGVPVRKEELVDRQGKTRDVDAISYSARSKARRSKKKVEKRLDRFRETKWLALRSRLKIVFT